MSLSLHAYASTEKMTVSSDKMVISIDHVVAKTEESVEVPVKIANNKGVCGVTITIDYDQTLILTDVSSGMALSSLTMTKPGNLNEKHIKILWDGIEPDDSNGEIALLTFKNPQKSGTYNIKVSYEIGDIIDGNLNPVEADMVDGSIYIKSADSGDNENICDTNGHKGGEATCIKKAVCTICEKEYGELDTTHHEGVTEIRDAKKATCEENGYSGDTYCKACNAKISEGTAIKATGHKFTNYISDNNATTEADGTKTAICDNGCGEKNTIIDQGSKKDVVPEKPEHKHVWEANYTVDKEATYTETGSKSIHCATCSATKDVQIIPKKVKTLKLKDKITWNKQVYKVTGVGKNASVEYLGTNNAKATSIIIPATVKINNVTYKVTSVASNAFKNNKKVTKVTIGSNMKTIGANAFYGCTKLKEITLGKNVSVIKDKAFYKCTSLSKITIPSKVEKIGKQAFYGCGKLKSITIKTSKLNTKNVGSKAFKRIYSKASVKVPKAKRKSYKTLFITKGAGKKISVK